MSGLFETVVSVFGLRWYQQEALLAIFKDFAEGVKNTLVSIVTGGGKTRLFAAASAIIFTKGEKRIIVLAHTEELVNQPLEVFKEFFLKLHPKAKLGIVKAESKEYDADVMFCTVQTLANNYCYAVYQILLNGGVDMLVVDEAHHLIASTYLKVKGALTSVVAWNGLRSDYIALRDRIDVISKLPRSRAIVVALGEDEFSRLSEKEQEEFLRNSNRDEIINRLGEMKKKQFEDENELMKQLDKYLDTKRKAVERGKWILDADFTKIFPKEDMNVLGVSATPFRSGDDISLAEVFPEIEERGELTYCFTIREAIQSGVLAKAKSVVVRTNIERGMSDGKTEVFDLENGYELMIDRGLIAKNPEVFPTIDALGTGEGEEYVYEHHHQLVLNALKDKRLAIPYQIWFMPSLTHSKKLVVEAGSKYGLKMGHIDGSNCYIWDGGAAVPIKREDLLEEFSKKGDLCGLSNMMVLTEGYDAPFATLMVIARRTKLYGPFVQMFGRILRLDPDNPNKEAIVLLPDYSGHQLKDITGLIGQPRGDKAKAVEEAIKMLMPNHEASIPPCPKCQAKLERLKGTRYYKCTGCEIVFHGDDINDGLQEIFDDKKISGVGNGAKILELFAREEVAWTKEGDLWSVSIGVGQGTLNGVKLPKAERTYFIVPPNTSPRFPDKWNLIEIRRHVIGTKMVGNRFSSYPEHQYDGPAKGYVVAQSDSLEELMAIAQVRVDLLKEPRLADKNRAWRDKPIKEGMTKQLIDRFKLPESRVKKMNRGTASRYYAHYSGLQLMRKATIID